MPDVMQEIQASAREMSISEIYEEIACSFAICGRGEIRII
jgi:hypothetical protein